MTRPTSRLRRVVIVTVCGLALAVLLPAALIILTALSMQGAMADHLLTAEDLSASLSERYDCILVLGAGLKDDGSPSDMLYDRVATACTLYRKAPAPIPIIMSGDHTDGYNEVAAMKNLAVSLGVNSSDVFLDHEGYSTYESIYRAKAVFNAKRILVVTQEYHLYRALFIARELGMEADGVSADLRSYRGNAYRHLREYLARYKDLFQACRGETVGDTADVWVDLSGNGDQT